MYLTHPELWPALLTFIAFCTPMAITDAREHRLPLPLTLGLIGAGALTLTYASALIDWKHLINAGVSAVIVTLFMIGLFIAARAHLGFGDVILTCGLALFTGFISPIHAIGALWLGCLFSLAWALKRRREDETGPIPFGPGLIAGATLTLFAPALS